MVLMLRYEAFVKKKSSLIHERTSQKKSAVFSVKVR